MVREDDDRYAISLLRLTDAITERLAKTEALIRLMIGNGDCQRNGVTTNVAWATAGRSVQKAGKIQKLAVLVLMIT